MQYHLSEIANILGAELFSSKGKDPVLQHIVFDTRRIDFPRQSAFIAFPGPINDGHQYIGQAYEKGIRTFIISQDIDFPNFPEAHFLLVPDTLKALQKLATYHRQQFRLPVIGITGSNGKTVVKEWLSQLLQDDFTIVRSPLSYNSQIGVPLSVLEINERHNLGIFEAGISQKNEMQNLAPIVNCDIGIFTNIGEAHSEGFAALEEKIREKIQLFDNCPTIIYCADHEKVDSALSDLTDKHFLRWSRKNAANLRIVKEETQANGACRLTALYEGTPQEISIPFCDRVSVENAIHCWLLLLHLRIPSEKISERMEKLDTIPMRLELKAAINGSTLINDSYNSDLTSLAAALNFLGQQSGQLKRTLILSDIFQSGISKKALYRRVNHLLLEHRIDRIIGIGKEVQTLRDYSPIKQQTYFESTKDFLAANIWNDFHNEIILLKGARDFAFERIAQRLARKSHNTTLEIDLTALNHNLRVFKERLAPETKIMVMVKAAAYGSGSDEVARHLQFQQVDYLAVAYADEGVELRDAGVNLPIMVLNPERATFDLLLQYQLEPEIYSLSLLQQLIAYLPKDEVFPIHLKMDTGMHRLGFEDQDIGPLLHTLQAHPEVRVASIFSHLAASDEPEEDEFTKNQLHLFNAYYDKFFHSLRYRPIKHILNTNGILRFPEHQYDMVRLGIGLYGIDPNNLLNGQLKTVLRLKATISQIKDIPAGETIGYSRKGKAIRNMRIATISIGYADGLLRKAGNGRFYVKLRGKLAPIVGNVCMDMTMVDISHIPEAREGDEVLIFGKDHPVEILADCYESLVYEVFTGISERVKRVYYQE